MSLSEQTAISGNAIANTNAGNGPRWGDYSHLSIDPSDGITFWHTNMYTNSGYGSGSNVVTRIFSFQIPANTGISEIAALQPRLSAYQSGTMLYVKATQLPINDKMFVELFDINGKQIDMKPVTPVSNAVNTSFNITTLAKGVYFVRIGVGNFQRVVKAPIQ
jgi:hypothetical protein